MNTHDLPQESRALPAVLPFRQLLGPSFILLGLGLGSGEIILWPYLTSNYGLGIIWGIVAGVTIQFFINMEVERYALVNGESIFVGFARWARWLPLWFILSTFLGFGWPGIGLAGATLLFHASDVTSVKIVSVAVFLAIGIILSAGKGLYQTVEAIQKYLILVGSPLVLLLAASLARGTDWQALFAGLVGRGEGYRFLPQGMPTAAFLAAVAYSGAGGNLNLAQSFYVRDKGYGMGMYAQKIRSIFTDHTFHQHIRLTGASFPITAENLARFRAWWKVMNVEHGLVFWLLGLVTMLGLSVLAFSTTYGLSTNQAGITFVLTEAQVIANRTWPALGPGFLLVTGLMLSTTQLTVLDSTSRIVTENMLLSKNLHTARVSRWYYATLWAQIAFGIVIILSGFAQPRELITLGAVINAISMWIYTGLILYLNNFRLPAQIRPSWWRNLILLGSFVFLGWFGWLTMGEIGLW